LEERVAQLEKGKGELEEKVVQLKDVMRRICQQAEAIMQS
jgi:hypothetical protein